MAPRLAVEADNITMDAERGDRLPDLRNARYRARDGCDLRRLRCGQAARAREACRDALRANVALVEPREPVWIDKEQVAGAHGREVVGSTLAGLDPRRG